MKIRIFLIFIGCVILSVPYASASTVTNKFLNCGFWEVATPEQVQKMIHAGADINAVRKDKNNKSIENVFSIASYCSKNTDNVKVLLDNGVNTVWKNEVSGKSVAFFALFGNIEMIEFLYKKGIDFTVKDKYDCDVYHLSMIYVKDEKIIKRLYEIADIDINRRDCYNYTPLMLASRHNTPKVIELMLELGADVNLRFPSNLTNIIGYFPISVKPLYYARNREDLKNTKALELLERKTHYGLYDIFLEKALLYNYSKQ